MWFFFCFTNFHYIGARVYWTVLTVYTWIGEKEGWVETGDFVLENRYCDWRVHDLKFG